MWQPIHSLAEATDHGHKRTMAIREFSDATGRAWRAWHIRPESIHPQTKAEDYVDALSAVEEESSHST